MFLILDGKLEIFAQVWSNLSNLICIGHLLRSRAVTNLIFFRKLHILLFTCATCSKIPSDASTLPYIDHVLCISLWKAWKLGVYQPIQPGAIETMVLILDGSTEHVVPVWRKIVLLIYIFRPATAVDLNKCLKQIKVPCFITFFNTLF